MAERRTILVVEDNPDIIENYVKYLNLSLELILAREFKIAQLVLNSIQIDGAIVDAMEGNEFQEFVQSLRTIGVHPDNIKLVSTRYGHSDHLKGVTVIPKEDAFNKNSRLEDFTPSKNKQPAQV